MPEHDRPTSVIIDTEALVSIEQAAIGSREEECCGLLLGVRKPNEWRINRVIAAQNVTRCNCCECYEMDPDALLRYVSSHSKKNEEIVGFYHSHHTASANISPRDRQESWPEMLIAVAATNNGVFTDLRIWHRPIFVAELEEISWSVLGNESVFAAGVDISYYYCTI